MTRPPRGDWGALDALMAMARTDHPQARRLVQALRAYVEENRGDIKKLKGRDAEWRSPSGDWRLFFGRDPDALGIVVTGIDNRRDAYD